MPAAAAGAGDSGAGLNRLRARIAIGPLGRVDAFDQGRIGRPASLPAAAQAAARPVRRWRDRGRGAAHRGEHRVQVDDARGDAELAFDARPQQIARDPQIAVHPQIADLVLDDLEVPGGHVDVDAAELPFVNGQVAGDRQRLLVVVQDLDVGDVDAVGLELDAAVEIRSR